MTMVGPEPDSGRGDGDGRPWFESGLHDGPPRRSSRPGEHALGAGCLGGLLLGGAAFAAVLFLSSNGLATDVASALIVVAWVAATVVAAVVVVDRLGGLNSRWNFLVASSAGMVIGGGGAVAVAVASDDVVVGFNFLLFGVLAGRGVGQALFRRFEEQPAYPAWWDLGQVGLAAAGPGLAALAAPLASGTIDGANPGSGDAELLGLVGVVAGMVYAAATAGLIQSDQPVHQATAAVVMALSYVPLALATFNFGVVVWILSLALFPLAIAAGSLPALSLPLIWLRDSANIPADPSDDPSPRWMRDDSR